jgi:K+-sensing histidine kinase KdpD
LLGSKEHMSSEESRSESPSVPWPDMVKFVRQLGHDLRNNLNAVELQSAYLAELAEGGELKGEILRLREMVSGIGTSLQKISASLSQANPNLMPYSAADFIEDLRQKLASEFPNDAAKVNWDVQFKDEQLQIDPQMAQQALLELFANAFQHERNVKTITAKAYIEHPAPSSGAAGNGRFVFELREPKARFDLSMQNWGREPLQHVGHSRYGLGLNRTRVITEAHAGNFRAHYERETSTLVTTISLPLTAR